MRNALGICFLFLLLSTPAFAQEQVNLDSARWEKALVTLDVTRKQYEYLQPWSKRLKTGQKTGVVIGARQILTTADELFDRTLVRIQRGGRGKWWTGELSWIDY